MSSVAAYAVALLAAGLGLVACLGPVGTASPTDVLKARLAALASARSVVLDGSVALEGANYPVTLNVDAAREANGTVTVDQKPVAVAWVAGRLFLKGADYLNSPGLYVGSGWVLAQGDQLQAVVPKLANTTELVGALTAIAGSQLRPGPTSRTGPAGHVQPP